jgi:hypothetical protein
MRFRSLCIALSPETKIILSSMASGVLQAGWFLLEKDDVQTLVDIAYHGNVGVSKSESLEQSCSTVRVL